MHVVIGRSFALGCGTIVTKRKPDVYVFIVKIYFLCTALYHGSIW